MNTNSKIVLGVVGAAVAGAMIGLLVAPDKGSELRNKLSGNAKDVINGLTDWLFSKGEEISKKKVPQADAGDDGYDDNGRDWEKAKKDIPDLARNSF